MAAAAADPNAAVNNVAGEENENASNNNNNNGDEHSRSLTTMVEAMAESTSTAGKVIVEPNDKEVVLTEQEETSQPPSDEGALIQSSMNENGREHVSDSTKVHEHDGRVVNDTTSTVSEDVEMMEETHADNKAGDMLATTTTLGEGDSSEDGKEENKNAKIIPEKSSEEASSSSGSKEHESTSSSSEKKNEVSSEAGGNANNSPTTTTTTTGTEQSVNDTRRRVKLYMLNQNRTWDDRGTGHVTSPYCEEKNTTLLLVKSESDGSTLLESAILLDTAYQKQQDTLIVWSDNNYELALSFQERAGCDEIWNKICEVQHRDPSNDFTQEPNEDDENDLPSCEVDRLDEINLVIASSLNMPTKKEAITSAIENEQYIQKMLTIFRQLEEKKDVLNLQKLYEIFKNIFLLNRNSLFDILLKEEHLWDVIGIFEYDPTGAAVREATNAAALTTGAGQADAVRPPSPQQEPLQPINRAANTNSYFTSLPSSSESELMRLIREKRHREFLRNMARFKEVIPLEKSDLVSKIHQTYRVQYIQDVIVPTPTLFEDNMLSTLSSFIFLNKVEIVTLIKNDEKFLKELFRQLTDESPSFAEKRRDLVLFLKELCTFSHTLQLPNRELFVKTLNSYGILATLEMLLLADDLTIKSGAVDIIIYLVDYSPTMVRDFALQEETNTNKKSDRYLLNILIEQMVYDPDPEMGMATQISGILKMLMDPDNMLTTSGITQRTEKSEFLNYFYKHCIQFMAMPIMIVCEALTNIGSTFPATQQQRISCQTAQLLSIVLELLTFCIEHHAYHIRSYLLQKHVIRSIMLLTKSRHTFLVLGVVRFIRRLVGLKDEFYNRNILADNHFAPIIDAFLSNRGRYNLLDSAIIDIFEFIQMNQITTLCNYTIENFWKNKLERVDYVKTFRTMKNFYDQQHQIRERLDNTLLFNSRHRYRRDPRQLEKDEDMWFNAEEDDEDEDECADDDDEEDCENYHDDDDDQTSPPHRQSMNLTEAAAAAAAAFHQFGQSGASGAGAGGGTDGLFSRNLTCSNAPRKSSMFDPSIAGIHPPPQISYMLAGTQQQHCVISSTTTTTTSNSFQSTSSYENTNPFSVDSPFFAAAGNSGLGNKKKSDRKTLTINLNSKTSTFISSATNNSNGTFGSTVTASTSSVTAASGAVASYPNNQQQQLAGDQSLPSSQQTSSNTNFVKSFSPVSFQNAEPPGASAKSKGLVDYPDEDSDEDDEDEVHEEEDDLEEEDDEVVEEDDELLKCESAFASTSGRKDTSLSSLRAKSVQLTSSTTAKHPVATSASPSTALKDVVSSNASQESLSSEEGSSNSSNDSGDSCNLQSRILSSCQPQQEQGDGPSTTTTATSSLVISEAQATGNEQECVTSSRSEVSTSSSALATPSGGVAHSSTTITTTTTTNSNKRRLSDGDDEDDDARISMSDEVAVSAGGLNEDRAVEDESNPKRRKSVPEANFVLQSKMNLNDDKKEEADCSSSTSTQEKTTSEDLDSID